ncbi:hypothetical protein KKH18_07560, partial [bacterium]|nr:hypothetical protein [bacterium]
MQKKQSPPPAKSIETHWWKTLYIMGLPHFVDGAEAIIQITPIRKHAVFVPSGEVVWARSDSIAECVIAPGGGI